MWDKMWLKHRGRRAQKKQHFSYRYVVEEQLAHIHVKQYYDIQKRVPAGRSRLVSYFVTLAHFNEIPPKQRQGHSRQDPYAKSWLLKRWGYRRPTFHCVTVSSSLNDSIPLQKKGVLSLDRNMMDIFLQRFWTSGRLPQYYGNCLLIKLTQLKYGLK